MKFTELQQKSMLEWERFTTFKRPRILIGAVTCGRAAGALDIRNTFERKLSESKIKADIYEVGCIGMCYAEPLVEIGLGDGRRVLYNNVTPEAVPDLIDSFAKNGDPRPELALASFGDVSIKGIPPVNDLPMIKRQVRIVLRNAGVIDPTNIHHYISRRGYTGLSKALCMTPDEVVEEVTKSGLRGRGGAGFPTGVKWGFARKSQSDEKYVICNADEGDPGAFMDRSVLESDPHAVLEGLVICAYAIGAKHGYIYVRAEYPLAIERLKTAIKQMEEFGFLGKNIMGSSFNFTVKIKEGAGAFVCGEETALMASIEGLRGMPRPRPPFPANSGLHGKPTNINNVETLANVSAIMEKGADWFAQYGTDKSRGTKTFALAGKINRTGLIEVPMGISLRDIIYTIGGGIPDNRRFKAVQTGGPSGGCIPSHLLDMPVDYEKLTEAGTIMGSGGMVVMDDETCMVDIARYFLEFTQNESCGKCAPCRMGTQHMLKILNRITRGEGKPEDIDLLQKIGLTSKNGSLCGLGQTIANPVITTIRHFRDEYESHINKYCPSTSCKRISPAPCQRTCPIGMDVPSYTALIGWERFDEALDVIYEDNPFPAVCGRICPRPCEFNCTRGETEKPLAIRALKRFAADYVREKSPPLPIQVEITHSERIAVVGAGPCGLSAAHDLAKSGYNVTVFESKKKAGGMLRNAVPDYRLDKNIIDNEVDRIASMVEIRRGQTLGRDFNIDKLLSDGYSAVLLAMGAPKGIPLTLQKPVKSKDYIDAVKFLTSAKSGGATCPGQKIVVIGSSHLAIDAARTAVRLGASKVSIVYPRAKKDLPLSSEELKEATLEGITFEYHCMPEEVIIKKGVIKGIRCKKTRPGTYDNVGRNRPENIAGSGVTIPCEAVISAIGHKPDTGCLKDESGITLGILDNIIVNSVTLETDKRGVFAAGDVVSGGTTVIEAIAAGQKAAASIHRQLRKQNPDYRFKLPKPRRRIEFYEVEEELENFQRPEEPLLSIKNRKTGFEEVVKRYPVKTAVKEAKRCLRCDLD